MDRSLIDLVRDRDELADLDPASRRLALRELLTASEVSDDVGAALGELSDWIDGYGPLTGLMRDPTVSDILVNGPADVWVERRGRLEREHVSFSDPDELLHLIERWLGSTGARADTSHPIGEARLPDGSRLHVVMPPVAPHGPLLSIRRFPPDPYPLSELVRMGLLGAGHASFLREAVVARRTIVIGGATGAGKTTLANALLGCVPAEERVVIIEETPELKPAGGHWVSLVTRSANHEGAGALDQSALLRAALRMRPDRIVVGEARGPEVSVALQAMATGHEGSLLTVHARCAADVPARLIELALLGGDTSERIVRGQVERSIDVVVQLGRRRGRRFLEEIIETGRVD